MSGYIAKSGYKFIAIFAVLLCIAWVFDIFILFFIALFILSVYFFRDPSREPCVDDALALFSPIDGKVKEIAFAKFQNAGFSDDECVKVVIEKSLLGVGVLRSPCDISELNLRRRHGLFLCNHIKNSDALNERALYTGKNGEQILAMRIIAGVFSRGLDLLSAKSLKAAKRFGFLGSGKVVLFLPRDTKICVSVGEKVRSSEILGYFKGGIR